MQDDKQDRGVEYFVDASVVWPEHWPQYHNANVDACDFACGHCACGACHQPKEFEFRPGEIYVGKKNQVYKGVLFRYGLPVGGFIAVQEA